MVKHCRRCGLPRRRPLLTPDGKTFSFPGFRVRRHRGLLLLASGAALCCCCADQEVPPISDTSNPGTWEDTTGGDSDGALWDEIDEIPFDDATSYVRKTLPAVDGTTEFKFRVKFDAITDYGYQTFPDGGYMQVRVRANGPATTLSWRMRVFEGSTQRAATSPADLTGDGWGTFNVVPAEADYNAISDWTNIHGEIGIIDHTSGGSADVTSVKWIYTCP